MMIVTKDADYTRYNQKIQLSLSDIGIIISLISLRPLFLVLLLYLHILTIALYIVLGIQITDIYRVSKDTLKLQVKAVETKLVKIQIVLTSSLC